jgi:hypothetical protein
MTTAKKKPLTKEEKDFISSVRAIPRHERSRENQSMLDALIADGDIPDDDILTKIGDTARDPENQKFAAGIATDTTAAYAGHEAMRGRTELRSERGRVKGFGGWKGWLANKGAAALSAMLSDRYLNQGLIHGVPPEEMSGLQTGLSGAAEVVVPPAMRATGQMIKGAGGVVGDILQPLTKRVGDSNIGNFFRQLIGKAPVENPDFSVQAGDFIEKQAEKIRTGERANTDISEASMSWIESGKLSTRVATEVNHRLIELFDGIANASFFGGKPMETLRKAGGELLESGVNDFVARFKTNMTPGELSKFVRNAVRKNIKYAEGLRAFKFKALDIKGKGIEGFRGVDLSNIVGGKGDFSFREAVKHMDAADPKTKAKILKKILKAADEIDRGKPSEIMQSADDLIQEFLDTPGVTGNKEWIKAQVSGESAKSLVEKAIAFNAKNAELINNTSIRSIANSDPEMLLGKLFQDGKPDTLNAVLKLKDSKGKLVLNETHRNSLRAAWLGTAGGKASKMGKSGILTEASDIVKGVYVLNGVKLERILNNAEGRMGTGVGRALFPGVGKESGFGTLRKFAKFLQSQQRDSGGVGAIAFVLGAPSAMQSLVRIGAVATAGVVTGVVTDNHLTTFMTVVGAGTLLFSPKGMAAFLANPKTRHALLNGIKKNSNRGVDHLFKYMQSATAQALAKSFGATYVSNEEMAELTDIRFQGGDSARIGGAETPLSNLPTFATSA